MSKEKFLVLDVEGFSGLKPYDVGYIIADRYGRIYKQRSFCLLPNLLENSKRNNCMDDDCKLMTIRNFSTIMQDNEKPKRKRKWQIVNNTEFCKIFTKEIKKFNVKNVYAFNCSFDKAMIENICKEKNVDLSLEWRDIQTAIIFSKCKTKKYLDFCLNNNYRTPKGYARTKAETIYQYLNNDLTFSEEHTGLADVLIEYDILLSAFKTHKKLKFNGLTAWKFLNDFAKEINHPIAIGN